MKELQLVNVKRAGSIVFPQPVTDEERKQALEAMQGCPTESIGDDGDAT